VQRIAAGPTNLFFWLSVWNIFYLPSYIWNNPSQLTCVFFIVVKSPPSRYILQPPFFDFELWVSEGSTHQIHNNSTKEDDNQLVSARKWV